jgi:erythromycin esterase
MIILLLSSRLFAQQPLNLDFEKKSVEGINRPWGWNLKSPGPVVFKMDSLIVKTGEFSLNSICVNTGDQNVKQSLSFGIEAFELKGKKITLTGSMRTEGLKGTAGFSLGYNYLNKTTGEFIEFDTSSAKISGTSGWKTFSVSLFIPGKAQSVYVLADHSGNGKAWFDDLKLSIAGKAIRSVQVANSLSKKNIRWLHKNSFPVFHIVAKADESNNDLEPFKKITANSRLIALGESTHGTGEFFSLKHRLFQYAVTQLGFRVFAIEDNQLAVEEVNKYVHGSKENVRKTMGGMFAVWNTEEVLALVEWIRGYNDSHVNDKLSFVGFDIQEISRPLDSLISFLKEQDIDLYYRKSHFLKELKENGPKSYAVTDSIKLVWSNEAKEMLNDVQFKSTQWISTSKNSADIEKIVLGIQYATW